MRTHIARTRHFVPVTFKVKWKTRRRSSRLRTACHWAYSKTAKKFFELFSIQIEYCTSVRTVRPYETRAEEKLFSFVTNGVVRQSRRGPYPLPRPPPSALLTSRQKQLHFSSPFLFLLFYTSVADLPSLLPLSAHLKEKTKFLSPFSIAPTTASRERGGRRGGGRKSYPPPSFPSSSSFPRTPPTKEVSPPFLLPPFLPCLPPPLSPPFHPVPPPITRPLGP